MDKENFQKTLQLLRIICKVSTAEISEELGIPEERYNLLEEGDIVPTESEVEKIAAFYNTTVDDLLKKDINNFYIQAPSVNHEKVFILSFSEKLLLLFFRRMNLIYQDKIMDLVMQCYFECDKACQGESTGIAFNMKSDCPTELMNNEPSLINVFREIPDKDTIFRFIIRVNEYMICEDE